MHPKGIQGRSSRDVSNPTWRLDVSVLFLQLLITRASKVACLSAYKTEVVFCSSRIVQLYADCIAAHEDLISYPPFGIDEFRLELSEVQDLLNIVFLDHQSQGDLFNRTVKVHCKRLQISWH